MEFPGMWSNSDQYLHIITNKVVRYSRNNIISSQINVCDADDVVNVDDVDVDWKYY